MALNYRALTNNDVQRLSVMPQGEYDFYVSVIEEKKSKGGMDKEGKPKKILDMLEVTLKIINPNGGERQVKDWIMIVADEDRMGFKLRHFAHTCGLIIKYEGNALSAKDFLGKHGRLKLGVREYIDNMGEVKKQNSVIDYICPKAANSSSIETAGFDDDIPDNFV